MENEPKHEEGPFHKVGERIEMEKDVADKEGAEIHDEGLVFHLEKNEEMDVVKLQERLDELYKEINEIEQKLGIAESKTAA